jgi:hypoxanthine phosphoribosyltransferase
MKILFDKKTIQDKVSILANQISKDYLLNKHAMFIIVLKGSIHFASDLLRFIPTINIPVEFIRVKSYEGTSQSQFLSVTSFLKESDIKGKDVLIIEDIIDSGKTLERIIFYVNSLEAKSINICTLLNKPSCRKVEVLNDKYVGFNIEDQFVVGYGLDFKEKYRNLSNIMILEESDL